MLQIISNYYDYKVFKGTLQVKCFLYFYRFLPQQTTVREVRQWPLLELALNPNNNGQGFGYYEPENAVPKEQFHVYWNVPTFQCHQYGLNFSEVRRWGIIENENGNFRGNEIALLYDPGVFPALLRAGGGDFVKRNGGVPQEGDLTQHMQTLEAHVVGKLIPDPAFSGELYFISFIDHQLTAKFKSVRARVSLSTSIKS